MTNHDMKSLWTETDSAKARASGWDLVQNGSKLLLSQDRDEPMFGSDSSLAAHIQLMADFGGGIEQRAIAALFASQSPSASLFVRGASPEPMAEPVGGNVLRSIVAREVLRETAPPGHDASEVPDPVLVIGSVQDRNTILAALRFYQARGMGDPANRSDAIDDIATNGGEDESMGDIEIDDLCERVNSAAKQPPRLTHAHINEAVYEAGMQPTFQQSWDLCAALDRMPLYHRDEHFPEAVVPSAATMEHSSWCPGIVGLSPETIEALDKRREQAEAVYARYDFEMGVNYQCPDDDWEHTADNAQWRRGVMVEADNGEGFGDREVSLTFTVRFNRDGSVAEAVARDRNDRIWGKLRDAPIRKPDRSAIPQAVMDHVNIALNALREQERALLGVQRARGNGHTLALELRDRQGRIEQAREMLAEFRRLAPNNRVNAEEFIEQMGGEPDFSQFGEPAVPAPAMPAQTSEVQLHQATRSDPSPTPDL